MKKKILIIGKIPPPIGGVTIHVKRLLDALIQKGVKFQFIELSKSNFLKIVFLLFKYEIVHLHTSNPKVRVFFTFFSKLGGAKLFITYHGDIGRFKSSLDNRFDLLSIKYCFLPILLNDKSLKIAIQHNNKAQIVSSFIPPNIHQEVISETINRKINSLKDKYEKVFCTNAYNISYDKEGNEIYGIYEILDTFKKSSQYGLVFSDPSGAYTKEFLQNNVQISDNVLLISEPHSFYKVLSLCDASIRNTTTDGDSLSVKESLYLKKRTLCTDVVTRPDGVFLYKRGELLMKLSELKDQKYSQKIEISDASVELINLYQKNIK